MIEPDRCPAGGEEDGHPVHVTFSKPVATYVTNFLDFPAGTHVPAAYYDEAKQAWVPAPDGVTLKILSVSGDAAAIDVTGDDVADTGAALDEWGITNDELKQLKKLYAPGVSLWRVAVRHFTPWDYNWPYGCESLCPPPKEPPPPPSYCPECQGGGSIVGLFNQTLGESVHVIGTPFELAYESDRVPGFKEAYTIRIPLTGGGISPNLERVDLRVSVAGREFDQSFPASANLKYVFTWDGKDAFGRVLEGAQLAHVQIGYAYKAVYLEPLKFARSFAQYGGAAVTGDRARKQISVWQAYDRTIGVLGTGTTRG